jgi:hypothetical protein
MRMFSGGQPIIENQNNSTRYRDSFDLCNLFSDRDLRMYCVLQNDHRFYS